MTAHSGILASRHQPDMAFAHEGVRVEVLRPPDLTAHHLSEWRRFQSQAPELDSPFLDPEFVKLVAQVRSDVMIGVAKQGGTTVGFFPFQRRGGVGRPVGGALSDHEAVIAVPGWACDPRLLIRACGLSAFDFSNLRVAQGPFVPFHRNVRPSHVIDLSAGFDAYVQERRAAGRNVISQTMSHARRLERQLGPLRFALHDRDPQSLRQLIEWKRQQYARTPTLDALSHRWTRDVLELVHATQTESFGGVLSTLSAGDRLIAAHMGMRSRRVLHWWFPAYDVTYSKLAPGRILLLELMRNAGAAGICSIDLGAGDEDYKLRFANSQILVAAGFVASGGPSLWSRQLRYGIETLASRLPIGRAAQWPSRVFHRIDVLRALW